MITQGDFDLDAVTRLRTLGGDALVGKIATIFADYGSARVADALSGGETGDLPRVAAAAHALRSSAANIGATRLFRVATDLEQAARTNQTENIAALVISLDHAFAGARVHIQSFIPGGVS